MPTTASCHRRPGRWAPKPSPGWPSAPATADALSAALDAAATGARDPSLRAWIELRHASSVHVSDSGARAIAFEEALRIAPAHPLALPIYLAERSVDTAGAAAALARGGRDATIPAFARVASLAAVSLQALSGDHAGALRAAQELLAGNGPADREARALALRCAVALGEPRGPAAAASLPRARTIRGATTRRCWRSPRPG